jgi:hypothetical protein
MEEIRVKDNVTKKIFVFKSQEDKEKFFNTWDDLVVRVEDEE